MARTYKRDKNGKFASTGGGGGLRKSVQAKRSVAATTKANGGLEQTTPKSIRGGDSGKKVLKGATYRDKGGWAAHGKVSAKAMSENKYYKPDAAAVKKSNELLASGHRKSIASSGASGRGKSLRQTVQAKRSIGANRRYEESAAAKNLDGKAGAAKSDLKAGKWYREVGKPRVGDGARVPSGASGRKAGLAKGGSPAAGTQTKRFSNAGGSSSKRSQEIAKGYNLRQERNSNASIVASSKRHLSKNRKKK